MRPPEDRDKMIVRAYDISGGDLPFPVSIDVLQKQLGWDQRDVVSVASYFQDKNLMKIKGKDIFLTAYGIDYAEQLKKKTH